MTIETYDEIAERVRALLSTPEGITHIKKRRANTAKIAKGIEELKSSGWILKAARRRVEGELTVFTVTQGALQNARKGLKIYVEYRGKRVGTLIEGDSSPVFITNDGKECYWKASAARDYIIEWSRKDTSSPERDIQGVLMQDIIRSPKHPLLQNLSPVRPANCLMEFPAPIQSEGKIGTGNIDLLLRTGRGRWPTFVVCELKADNTTPYDAFVQAIQYAIGLDLEINGIPGQLEPANRIHYCTFFGKAPNPDDPFRFGAMVVLRNRPGVEAAACGALKDLKADNVWLDVMLFDCVKNGKFSPVRRFR